ncbi:M48 family metallopeptidase [Pseudorhodoplanes sp.]|uniref:M48 family metallopeptidase n=1 Tax=Pseudorhodoplanes sp. TaxID=1934341 RepID=UPI00391ADF31
MSDTATHSGPGVYFDGLSAARHDVTVACMAAGIEICDLTGRILAEWPYDRLAHLNAPSHVFRLGLRNSDRLARLEIVDPDLADAVDRATPLIDRADPTDRAGRRAVVVWGFVAAASLLLVAFYGGPRIADGIARLVPDHIEQHLGRAGDLRFRATYDTGTDGRPFECGVTASESPGKAAFGKLMSQVTQASGLTLPVQAVVVRREEPNAFALAGGSVYVLQGLIEQAQSVDEVAAVIAHELGHVANRDGIRSVVQSAGLSLVFGIVLGDFVGGAAVVVAAHMLMEASYSRRQEMAADDFALRTLQELNADPRALATFLERVARAPRPGMSIFHAHPSIPERVARIKAVTPSKRGGAPLLDEAEWQALRRICAG